MYSLVSTILPTATIDNNKNHVTQTHKTIVFNYLNFNHHQYYYYYYY